jgi:hypothetical protein
LSEHHWTLRIFASTPNGGSGSVYLGGVHAFPFHSSFDATFRRRSKDSKRSPWKYRSFADVEVYELTTASDIYKVCFFLRHRKPHILTNSSRNEILRFHSCFLEFLGSQAQCSVSTVLFR